MIPIPAKRASCGVWKCASYYQGESDPNPAGSRTDQSDLITFWSFQTNLEFAGYILVYSEGNVTFVAFLLRLAPFERQPPKASSIFY
jgi:hypothetical protein